MKTIVKVIALMICAIMVLSVFAACGDKAEDAETDGTETAAAVKDLDAVKEKGKLIVGITDYAPMNYKDADGAWTGFDTEFAEAFGKILGVEIEFVEIDWDNKWFELESGNIDCVWNGMTITEEAQKNADVSAAYAKNNQVLVMAADAAADVKEIADFTGKVAVESGSAGMTAAEDAELEIVECQLQTDALLSVKSGKTEGCVIDATMALAMIKDGSDYEGLTVALTLTDEEYGVAFRKGSDLTAEFNKAFDALIEDGTLADLSAKYNIELTK